MFITLIITFVILLMLIAIMSVGYIFNNKSLKGSCGNSDDNPCTCNFLEKFNCPNKV